MRGGLSAGMRQPGVLNAQGLPERFFDKPLPAILDQRMISGLPLYF
jgi:hypothetical protein